jgi:hypothetical protein
VRRTVTELRDVRAMASSGGAKQVIEGSPYRIGLAKKKVRRM